MNDARTLRRRQEDFRNASDQAPPPLSRGNESWLLKTVTVASYPTTAIGEYGVQRVILGGAETEGAVPSFTMAPTTFYAANIGIGVPPPGTYVVGDLISGRWAFHYDG